MKLKLVEDDNPQSEAPKQGNSGLLSTKRWFYLSLRLVFDVMYVVGALFSVATTGFLTKQFYDFYVSDSWKNDYLIGLLPTRFITQLQSLEFYPWVFSNVPISVVFVFVSIVFLAAVGGIRWKLLMGEQRALFQLHNSKRVR